MSSTNQGMSIKALFNSIKEFFDNNSSASAAEAGPNRDQVIPKDPKDPDYDPSQNLAADEEFELPSEPTAAGPTREAADDADVEVEAAQADAAEETEVAAEDEFELPTEATAAVLVAAVLLVVVSVRPLLLTGVMLVM